MWELLMGQLDCHVGRGRGALCEPADKRAQTEWTWLCLDSIVNSHNDFTGAVNGHVIVDPEPHD